MAKPSLTPALRADYERLHATCEVRPERLSLVDGLATRVAGGRGRYESIGAPLAIPWFFIGLVHCMEAGLREGHLHNGDPLDRRTVNHPAGRPKTGQPPFTFEYSARDALVGEGLDRWSDWSLAGMLYRLEAYNGFGYRQHHPEVPSPYLWSFSTHYDRGKYVRDGVWDPNARSQQCGAAVLLRRLVDLRHVAPPATGADAALVPPSSAAAGPRIRYSMGGPPSEDARRLQRFLADVEGVPLVADGKAGRLTSDATKRVLGHYLVGDPRA